MNGVAYWMSKDAFFVFDGTVKKIPCTVQDYVFEDLNIAQATAVNVGINTQFNEVTWFYPSLSSDYVNRFVTYNYLENVWSIGSMARTAWTDIGTFEKPLATKYDPLDNEATITTIYGLAANTTYHVRAYAINSAGTSYGTDVSFSTTAAAARHRWLPATADQSR